MYDPYSRIHVSLDGKGYGSRKSVQSENVRDAIVLTEKFEDH